MIISRKELKSLNGKIVKRIHSYSTLKEEEVRHIEHVKTKL